MELKGYEFNAHGIDLGQFYESAAVVRDGSERPQPAGKRPGISGRQPRGRCGN